jgi:hypothetical protein
MYLFHGRSYAAHPDFMEGQKIIANQLDDITHTSFNTTKSHDITAVAIVGAESLIDSLVVVTAMSSNHYNEALDMIGSLHHFLPNTQLFIYDLGLKPDQITALKTFKNVQVRTYDFKAYPDFRDQKYRGLGCYAWKPRVINEVSKEHNLVMWLDASIRIVNPLNTDGCIETVNTYSFSAPLIHVPGVSMGQFLRDKSLEYLNVTRQDLKDITGFQSGCLMFKMDSTGRSLMDEWVECTFHRECICGGDLGTGDHCHHLQKTYQKNHLLYVGCHRYDQATLTVLCAKKFGIENADKVVTKKCAKVFKVDRHPTNDWRKYIMIK